MNKKIVAILGLSLVLTACGNKNTNNNQNNSNNNLGNKIENAVMPEDKVADEKRMADGKNISYEDIKLTPEEAAKIFREKFADVKLKDISLEKEYNSYVYKLSGETQTEEYEIEVNPVTAEIIKEYTEKDKDFVDDFEILDEDLVKINPLIEKALADAGEGYTFYEWDIEVDDGRKELNVELKESSGKDVEYKYNVETEELIEKDN